MYFGVNWIVTSGCYIPRIVLVSMLKQCLNSCFAVSKPYTINTPAGRKSCYRGRASLMKDYEGKYFFFGITCTDESFTIRLGTK